MANLFYDISRFLLPLLFAVYMLVSLIVLPGYFRRKKQTRDAFQFGILFLLHLAAYTVLTLQNGDLFYLIFFAVQELIFIVILNLYRIFYPGFNRPLLNHMFALISVGMIMISRLSVDKAIKQFVIITVSFGISLCIPFLIRKFKMLRHFVWIYAGIGAFMLLLVLILGTVTNGSKLSYTILGITFQPSEFVKILFVLFLGALLAKGATIINVLLATAVTIVNVAILIVSKDLGSAAIFFVCYLVVVFVASGKLAYLLSGLALAGGGAMLAYKMFYHVKVRIIAWLDPFSDYTGKGFQIAQSLFAISTGGWFGMGLCQGTPGSIPFVEEDFIFSAIAEELGVVFSICFILCCICVFLIGMSIAFHVNDKFYKYTALGISVMYIFQVFLTIGGGTKFIPMTGVTLPFVSYGGSSVMATILMFAILQGISIQARVEAGLVEEIDDAPEEQEEIEAYFDMDEEDEDADIFYVTNSYLLPAAGNYQMDVKLKKKE